jgi:hypothetical protein
VGHCSIESTKHNATAPDDDIASQGYSLVRFRPLYLMWVCSMLITGISAAYRSVIGYTGLDFAVANSRANRWVCGQQVGLYVQTKTDLPVPTSKDGGSSCPRPITTARRFINHGTLQF